MREPSRSRPSPPGGGWQFTFRGQPRDLDVVAGILAIERAPEDAEKLESQIESELPDWFVVEQAAGWTFFAHPSASPEVELLPAWEKAEGSPQSSPPSVTEVIGDLLTKIAGSAYFSPLFRDPLDPDFGLLVDRTIMLRFDEGTAEADALEVVKTAEAEVVPGNFEHLERAYLVRVGNARTAFEVLDTANWLAQQPSVSWAQPNFSVMGVRPNGPCLPVSPSQAERNENWWDDGTWGIDISGAWAMCGGADSSGPLVTVGIIGDGVELTHPDLNQPMIGDDFVTLAGFEGTTGAPVTTCDNHETTVAGMIAMVANGSGGVGSAPRVRIASARAHYQTVGQLGGCGPGLGQPQSWPSNALQWLYAPPPAGAGAKVVNYSWNHYNGDQGMGDVIETAFEQYDVLFVSSVGNGNQNQVRFPSNEPYVLGVGAIDELGQRWRKSGNAGSNYGTGLRYAAPGDNVYTTDRQGAAGLDSSNWVEGEDGTSLAAPLVAGVAALIRALRPDLSAADVDTILCSTAVKALPNWVRPGEPSEPLPECGLVDAAAALAYAQIYDPALEDHYETGDFSRWSRTGSP